jgi:hypothetical protein
MVFVVPSAEGPGAPGPKENPTRPRAPARALYVAQLGGRPDG